MPCHHVKGDQLSIAPGKLGRAVPLQVLDIASSERQWVEQIHHVPLSGRFDDVSIDDVAWDRFPYPNWLSSVFSTQSPSRLPLPFMTGTSKVLPLKSSTPTPHGLSTKTWARPACVRLP